MRYSNTRMSMLGHCIRGVIGNLEQINQSTKRLMANFGMPDQYDVIMLIGANKDKKIYKISSVEELYCQAFLEKLATNSGLWRLSDYLCEIAVNEKHPQEFIYRALPIIYEKMASLLDPAGVQHFHIMKSNGVYQDMDDEKHPSIYDLAEGEHEFLLMIDTERGLDNFDELAQEVGEISLEKQIVIDGTIKVYHRLIGRTLIEIEFYGRELKA